jgi:RNA polymerase sigma-70 factor (ECF subfamily)
VICYTGKATNLYYFFLRLPVFPISREFDTFDTVVTNAKGGGTVRQREDAVSALYEREYDALCRAAYRTLGDWEAAQDLVQDTFLLALLKDALPAHPNPGAWLTLTLQNLVRNERRRLVSHGALPLDYAGELPAAEAEHGLRDILPAGLAESERELLTLRFERQLSYRELGERMGISENACRVKLFRTVEKCKKLL